MAHFKATCSVMTPPASKPTEHKCSVKTNKRTSNQPMFSCPRMN